MGGGEITGDVSALERNADGSTRMVSLSPRRYENLDAFKAQLRAILAGDDVVAPPAMQIARPVRAGAVRP